MIVTYVAVQTRENAGSEFEHVIREIQADVRQLPGCVRNEWFRDPETPHRYVMYGEFETRAHFQDYLNSPLVQRIQHELIPLLTAPPEFKHYEAVELE